MNDIILFKSLIEKYFFKSNGNLDMFMSGALAQKVTGKSRSEANSQN